MDPVSLQIKNNDKIMKTISKMAEHPENGVRMVVFLTEFDFNNTHSSTHKLMFTHCALKRHLYFIKKLFESTCKIRIKGTIDFLSNTLKEEF